MGSDSGEICLNTTLVPSKEALHSASVSPVPAIVVKYLAADDVT